MRKFRVFPITLASLPRLLLIFLALSLALASCENPANKTASKTYTVTFHSNGGNGIAEQTVKSGGNAVRPADPTRSGYTFDNWYSNAGLTTVYNFSTKVTGDISLYAKWNVIQPNSYTVTFNSNGGSNIATQTVNSGGTATRPANPSLSGYAFDNWYSNEGLTIVYNFSTPVTGNITLYAKWTEVPPGSFIVTFKSNGESNFSDQIVVSGGTAVRPGNLALSGYIFDNWYSDESLSTVYNFSRPVTGNITLYAKWMPITYTIIYGKNATDATGTMENSSHTYDIDKKLNNNAFTRTGYTFSGWAKTSTGAVEFTDGQSVKNLAAVAGGTVTLYAKWTLNQYTVTFNADDGTPAPSPQTVAHGSKVNEPSAMSRTGYTWGSWFRENSFTNQWSFAYNTVTDTITLYAKWNPITYTIIYNKNAANASGTMMISNHIYDVDQNLNTNIYTLNGYNFVGWARTAEGVAEFIDGATVKNLASTTGATVTLYAQWTGFEVINVPFTGSTEKTIPITRVITNNLSKSGGGSITLTINESFDRYEWFIGTAHVASGNNVTLQATNAAFIPGINWITVVVYTGTDVNVIPWSGEFIILVTE